jgi:hypothetical protein
MKNTNLKILIRYFLFCAYIIILYGSIIYPTFFYGQELILPLVFVFYIWLYTNIVSELQNQKYKSEVENTYFHRYFGNLINRYHIAIEYYFDTQNIISFFFELDTKGNLKSKNKIIQNIYVTTLIVLSLTFSLTYIISIFTFVFNNPIIGMITKNMLISIIELNEIVITKAQAMENERSTSEDIEKQLYKGTLPPINPVILVLGTGIITSYALKKGLYTKAIVESIKQLNKEKNMQAYAQLNNAIWDTMRTTNNMGMWVTAGTVAGMYIFLNNENPIDTFQYLKYVNPVEIYNDYRVTKNSKETIPLIIEAIKKAEKIEDLEKISHLYHKLPQTTRITHIKLYEETMFQARSKIKQ